MKIRDLTPEEVAANRRADQFIKQKHILYRSCVEDLRHCLETDNEQVLVARCEQLIKAHTRLDTAVELRHPQGK